jgi:hypothetical protein
VGLECCRGQKSGGGRKLAGTGSWREQEAGGAGNWRDRKLSEPGSWWYQEVFGVSKVGGQQCGGPGSWVAITLAWAAGGGSWWGQRVDRGSELAGAASWQG